MIAALWHLSFFLLPVFWHGAAIKTYQ